MFQQALRSQGERILPINIQSLYRSACESGDGNLLSAVKVSGTTQNDDIHVNFRGTNPFDPKTHFYQEPSHNGAVKLRCRFQNGNYILFVDGSKVDLRKESTISVSDEDKYLFKLVPVSHKYENIQLFKTNWFLQSDESGNASMADIQHPVDGTSKDRKTWFHIRHLTQDDSEFDTINVFSKYVSHERILLC